MLCIIRHLRDHNISPPIFLFYIFIHPMITLYLKFLFLEKFMRSDQNLSEFNVAFGTMVGLYYIV